MKRAIDAYNKQIKYISNGKEFYNGERKNLLEKIAGIVMKVARDKETKDESRREETSEEVARHQQFVQRLQQIDNMPIIDFKENSKKNEKEIGYEKE